MFRHITIKQNDCTDVHNAIVTNKMWRKIIILTNISQFLFIILVTSCIWKKSENLASNWPCVWSLVKQTNKQTKTWLVKLPQTDGVLWDAWDVGIKEKNESGFEPVIVQHPPWHHKGQIFKSAHSCTNFLKCDFTLSWGFRKARNTLPFKLKKKKGWRFSLRGARESSKVTQMFILLLIHSTDVHRAGIFTYFSFTPMQLFMLQLALCGRTFLFQTTFYRVTNHKQLLLLWKTRPLSR